MILSVTGAPDSEAGLNDLLLSPREQRRINSASGYNDPLDGLLNPLQSDLPAEPIEPVISTALSSMLVTPSASWTTSTSTTSYVTTVTHTETSTIPIILRGKKAINTKKPNVIRIRFYSFVGYHDNPGVSSSSCHSDWNQNKLNFGDSYPDLENFHRHHNANGGDHSSTTGNPGHFQLKLCKT